MGCNNLKSITIPENVITIEEGAFKACNLLTDIQLSNGLQIIGKEAFAKCNNLQKIFIPASVVNIDFSAFYYCDNFTEINVDTANTKYSSIEGVLYNKTKDTLLIVPSGKKGTFVVSKNVKSIGISAFNNCSELTEIVIPNNVKNIGRDAFFRCTALKNIIIPNSVDSVDNNTFWYCTSLQSVVLSENTTKIGFSAFLNCFNLTSIVIPKKVSSIGFMAFRDCQSLVSITNLSEIPQDISENTFDKLNLERIKLYIPESSLSAYQNAKIWQNFGEILPLQQDENNTINGNTE
jgi:hypothetical protein